MGELGRCRPQLSSSARGPARPRDQTGPSGPGSPAHRLWGCTAQVVTNALPPCALSTPRTLRTAQIKCHGGCFILAVLTHPLSAEAQPPACAQRGKGKRPRGPAPLGPQKREQPRPARLALRAGPRVFSAPARGLAAAPPLDCRPPLCLFAFGREVVPRESAVACEGPGSRGFEGESQAGRLNFPWNPEKTPEGPLGSAASLPLAPRHPRPRCPTRRPAAHLLARIAACWAGVQIRSAAGTPAGFIATLLEVVALCSLLHC